MQVVFIICFAVISYMTVCILMRIAVCDKEFMVNFTKRERAIGVGSSLAQGIFLGYLAGPNLTGQNMRKMILLSVFAGCLLMACITDRAYCRVYNFTWWLGGTAGLLLLMGRVTEGHNVMWKNDSLGLMLSLLVFGLLQELFFCRMYGRADCHAFLACAVVGGALGMGMREYLLHMLLAFGMLGTVQAWRRNIGRNGNLKQPVAFLPYITISFWGMLWVSAQ